MFPFFLQIYFSSKKKYFSTLVSKVTTPLSKVESELCPHLFTLSLHASLPPSPTDASARPSSSVTFVSSFLPLLPLRLFFPIQLTVFPSLPLPHLCRGVFSSFALFFSLGICLPTSLLSSLHQSRRLERCIKGFRDPGPE